MTDKQQRVVSANRSDGCRRTAASVHGTHINHCITCAPDNRDFWPNTDTAVIHNNMEEVDVNMRTKYDRFQWMLWHLNYRTLNSHADARWKVRGFQKSLNISTQCHVHPVVDETFHAWPEWYHPPLRHAVKNNLYLEDVFAKVLFEQDTLTIGVVDVPI